VFGVFVCGAVGGRGGHKRAGEGAGGRCRFKSHSKLWGGEPLQGLVCLGSGGCVCVGGGDVNAVQEGLKIRKGAGGSPQAHARHVRHVANLCVM
jgi:hypothetical protein